MKGGHKEFIGVTFKCCRIFSRININKNRTAYVGRCPKCAARIEVQITPTGSKTKYFKTS